MGVEPLSTKNFLIYVGACAILAFFLRDSALSYGCSHWTHELGHSVAAWLCAQWSIPILGVAITSPEPQIWFAFASSGLALYFVLIGYQQKMYAPVVLGFAFVLVQQPLAWLTAQSFRGWWITAGGYGGEFILPALLLSCCLYRWPTFLQQGLLTVFLVPWTIFAWFYSSHRWLQIYSHKESFPYGTFWHGPEAEGDMNRLTLWYDWTEQGIAQSAVILMILSASIFLTQLGWIAFRDRKSILQN